MRRGLGGVLAAVMASAMCLAATAQAADRVYWASQSGPPDPLVAFAALDGSGGGNLLFPTSASSLSTGVAIDSAAGRIYWADDGNPGKISFANLDGSGRADVPVSGATVNGPDGLAIDPLATKLYWANRAADEIVVANLDGSGATVLNTTGADVDFPIGVAIDPAGGRIYWVNNTGNQGIFFARLDGSGAGGEVNTGAATVDNPWGVALDLSAGRIYWGNSTTPAVSFANLNGSGGDDLNTTGATLQSAAGLAIDVPAGRIYWSDFNADRISFANLDGSGGGDLATPGATVAAPNHAALLKAPAAAGIPVITGGTRPGSSLSCSQGTWAPDLLEAHLYRAPSGFAFQWSRDGIDIPGATASSLTASEPGNYRCSVTASNFAGSSSQTSEPHVVALPTFGSETLVRLSLAAKRIPAKGPVKVRVKNGNDFAVDGRLSGRTPKKVTVAKRRVVKLKRRSFTVAGGARKTVKLKVPRALRKLLKRKGKIGLRLVAKVTDPSGTTRTVRKKVSPKLKQPRVRRP